MLQSKILYPIDFNIDNHIQTFWHQIQSHKVPASDSGIVIDTRTTSKSSSEDVRYHSIFDKFSSSLLHF